MLDVNEDLDIGKRFDYENGFYLTSSVARISKFATHMELFKRVANIPGEIIECGVFKGASLSRFIKFRSLFENCYSKKIIAFDTFAEFPKAQYQLDEKKRESFIKEAGDRSISETKLVDLLQKLNLYENIELIKGNVLTTVPDFLKSFPQLKISLLHIDVDLFEATKTCLECFYPYVSRKGIIILDDYGAFAGANKAVDDFLMDKDVLVEKLPYSNSISYIEKK